MYRRLLSLIVLIVIIGIASWVMTWWLIGHEERTAVVINAPHDIAEKGLPVFAQFVVTQKLRIDTPALMTRLEVPMFFPTDSEWLKIDLRKDRRLLYRWRYRPDVTDRIAMANLVFDVPQNLSGELELVFDGSHIPHDFQHLAPRLFIEGADYYYPAGNYRIAENKKNGDIGLTMFTKVTRMQVAQERWQKNHWLAAMQITQGLLISLLLMSVPFMIFSRQSALQGKKNPRE